MCIQIKDIVDVIVKASDCIKDTSDEVREIVQNEVIRITVDDTRDKGMLYKIAYIMDELEKEYSHQGGQGNVKLNRLLEEMTKSYFVINNRMTFIQKVTRIATKLKEVYNDLK